MKNTAQKLAPPDPIPASDTVTPANETAVSTDALLTPAQRLARSRAQLDAIRGIWRDLVAQTTEGRKASSGKVAARMMSPLRTLFQLAATPAWAPVFSALGVSHDPEHHVPFEPAQLLARIERYEALQEIHGEILSLAALVADDLLHHGAQIVSAGKPAIGLARTLAKTNPAFRGKVAPILNELQAMTASARKGVGAEDTDEDAEGTADEPEGDEPDTNPDA